MSNERATGRHYQLLLKRNDGSYGATKSGNYNKMPFVSTNLGMTLGLNKSPRAGVQRGPREYLLDVPVVGGDVVVPVCMRNIGYWLTMLLGDPSSSGSGPYVHTFSSETETLPDYCIEKGNSKVPSYNMNTGIKADSMQIEFTRSGFAQAKLGLVGQYETPDDTSAGGTPTEKTLAWASQFQGTVKIGGVAAANMNNATLIYNNNLEQIGTINQTNGQIEGCDTGEPVASGKLNVRFADRTLLDDAIAGTPVDLEFLYTISGSLSLLMTVYEAHLELPKDAVDGPGAVNLDINFQAARNTSAAKMFAAVLTNDLAGTTYTSP